MSKLDSILEDETFKKFITEVEEIEKNRKFCHHGLEHLLSVARIAYILNLREKLGIRREVIYGAALLHDIGRYSEYEKKMPHAEAGAIIAEPILEKAGYSDEEIDEMILAIGEHSRKGQESALSELLSRADRLSRNCFNCGAYDECNWKEEDKNQSVFI